MGFLDYSPDQAVYIAVILLITTVSCLAIGAVIKFAPYLFHRHNLFDD